MYKKEITYTGVDGVERTEEFYFHMMKSELIELQFSKQGGLKEYLEKIIRANSQNEIVQAFKQIILLSYGERSEDGRSFIKVRDGKKLSEEFAQTEAYNKLFMLLATDDNEAIAFINGVLPTDMVLDNAASGGLQLGA